MGREERGYPLFYVIRQPLAWMRTGRYAESHASLLREVVRRATRDKALPVRDVVRLAALFVQTYGLPNHPMKALRLNPNEHYGDLLREDDWIANGWNTTAWARSP